MRALLLVATGLSVACAPAIRLRREAAPVVPLYAHTLTVLPRLTSGDVAVDVLGAVLDPLGALNRAAVLTPEGARRFEAHLGSGGVFQVRPPCGDRPCGPVDAVAWVRVVDGGRRETTREKDRQRSFEGWASVEVSVVSADGTLLHGGTWRGRSTGTGDVVFGAVLDAAGNAADDFLPHVVVDEFTLVKDGPLAPAATLAAKGQLQEAERQVRAFLAANPSSGVGYFHLGAILTVKGDLDGAVGAMQAAEQLDDTYAGSLALAQRRVQSREALNAFLAAHGQHAQPPPPPP